MSQSHNRHREALIGVLVQVVQLAQAMGLIDTDEIALDGTNMAGNASLDANQAYEDLVAEEAAIEAWFAEVDAADEEATEGTCGKTSSRRACKNARTGWSGSGTRRTSSRRWAASRPKNRRPSGRPTGPESLGGVGRR